METIMNKKKIFDEAWRFLLVAFGTILFSGGINLFITPLNLYNGGALGIAQLLRTLMVDFLKIPFPDSMDVAGIVYFFINIPLLFLAYKGVSRLFFFKTVLSVLLTTFIITIIPVPNPLIIEDTLTSCIIGGLMYGSGVGLCLYAGGSGGGIDILGMYLSKRYRNFSVGKVTVVLNAFIYLACALISNLEIAIYSIIYAAISSLTVDRVHAQNIMVQVMIFTKKDNIAEPIMQELTRGVTEWEGEGAYTHEGTHILVTAISKYEINLLRRIVTGLDPQAFIIYNKVMNIDGNYVKKL
ncbi:MAG: YitT family protein [Lachnospiraceae bacterium]|nr:YitT family protein [Lachnospiraceae bacterium]